MSSISLGDGADEMRGGAELKITERGMRFTSRWQFSIGTQLAVACSWPQARMGLRKLRLEGIVVWCAADESHGAANAGGFYETTVLFLELPDELRQSLREFSHELAA